jgi:xylulokinase
LAPTVARALAAAGVAAKDVRALGVAGQLDGCIAVGKDGRALAPCLIWMDRRAGAEAAVVDPVELRRISGVTLDATHMAAKVRWLKRHCPEARRAARFHQPVSHLVARLTGEHVFDHALASTTMLYSLAARDYAAALLDAFEIDREELPAIAAAADVAGRLTAEGASLSGLPKGVAVAVGTGDDFSTPLGAGLAAPGRVACALGTAEVVGALDDTAKIDAAGLVETHGYPGGGFYVENPGWISGGALAWFRDTFGLADFAELDRLAGEVPPGAGGVTFIPALGGAMAPEWHAAARGCFYGLTSAHGTGHMARAVLEGCAFAMRDVVERLREMAVPADRLLLLGGGAKSRIWARIRADTTGLAAELPAIRDTSALGAAMCAAVAGGAQRDLATCAGLVGAVAGTVEPDRRVRPAYDDAYAAYRRLFDSLRPMFAAAR